MTIKYYKNKQLAFATRKRYLNISRLEPNAIEENNSIRFGNGANTTVKTSVENICDYVDIEGTRWFVTDYIYLNGGQVRLNLQRDVVGENGLENCFGKIERGYTDGILKYRKELSLNEVLKKRIPLIPTSKEYGNITINTHNSEMWGILYFTKDSSGKKVSINIPAFSPSYQIGTAIPDNTTYIEGVYSSVSQSFVVRFPYTDDDRPYDVSCMIRYAIVGGEWQVSSIKCDYAGITPAPTCGLQVNGFITIETALDVARNFCERVAEQTLIQNNTTALIFPEIVEPSNDFPDFRDKTIKDGANFYHYTAVDKNEPQYGQYSYDGFVEYLKGIGTYSYDIYRVTVTNPKNQELSITSSISKHTVTYNRTDVSPAEAGAIEIDMTTQLIDEPYVILAFPLYDVTITEKNELEPYVINRERAFTIFNEVIQGLSGESSFLVDAQIYPYCPDIEKKQTELLDDDGNAYPFFSVRSTSYTRKCEVQLLPYNDVKKEYITRNYSIVSPEQSSKFSFSFYDYVRENQNNGEFNQLPLKVSIKTALKPFAIISSAVIERVSSSTNQLPLKGINYPSNLEGSQPSSNGFECSLASDAFETYKRQNSNYQAIFNLDKSELQKQHEVEVVNEAVQGTMNILTQTAFGAIAGANMADVQILGNNVTKAAGAIAGAGLSAAVTTGATIAQGVKNAELRKYEEDLQQQRYDLSIGTIKNLPLSINRISSFNEIIMQEFYYVLEVYECTEEEIEMVDTFLQQYGYGIGIFGFAVNFMKDGWFLRMLPVTSSLPVTLHEVLVNDLSGGVYVYRTF